LQVGLPALFRGRELLVLLDLAYKILLVT